MQDSTPDRLRRAAETIARSRPGSDGTSEDAFRSLLDAYHSLVRRSPCRRPVQNSAGGGGAGGADAPDSSGALPSTDELGALIDVPPDTCPSDDEPSLGRLFPTSPADSPPTDGRTGGHSPSTNQWFVSAYLSLLAQMAPLKPAPSAPPSQALGSRDCLFPPSSGSSSSGSPSSGPAAPESSPER